jgi:mannose-1-phosphate guanylyltransferase / mannose-6-phosphate isomerase
MSASQAQGQGVFDILPVILCGGVGARLWPASTPVRPKPFLTLAGGRSLLQQTALRVSQLPGGRPPILVVGTAHAAEARAQLAAIDLDCFLLVEPVGRNSGPALAVAAAWIARRRPAQIVVTVASDHDIEDDEAFRASVATAAIAAQNGEIVTFGVKPVAASTAYGYIEPADLIAGCGPVRRVRRFVEKPDAETAEAFVQGGLLWNSGNFVFRSDAVLAEIGRHAPRLLDIADAAIDGGSLEDCQLTLGPAFAEAPNVSIDVAIMEKTARAAVVEIGHAWSDLGSWEAVWRASPRDGHGNVVNAGAVIVDSRDCLIRSGPGVRIVAIGLRNIAVVVENGQVLVCDIGASELVKSAVEDQ